MYEVDFLPVEATEGEPSTRNGDAITLHFTEDVTGTERVVVIDAGFEAVGDEVVRHINKYYGTSQVDLVISTHPDPDHLDGIRTVVEKLDVTELFIHRPKRHASPRTVQRHFAHIRAVDALLDAAAAHGTHVVEPFGGQTRFSGQLTVLGPARDLYETLLREQLDEKRSGALTRATRSSTGYLHDLVRYVAALRHPDELLADDARTNARNESSVITLVQSGGDRLLFTGDAGQRGLGAAADYYESLVGPFPTRPVALFQVPHHGDRRSLSPALLDRIVGLRGHPHTSTTAVVSSADADTSHPAMEVTNALDRRGITLVATEGMAAWSSHEAPPRAGWGPVEELRPLVPDEA